MIKRLLSLILAAVLLFASFATAAEGSGQLDADPGSVEEIRDWNGVHLPLKELAIAKLPMVRKPKNTPPEPRP